jgi:hypothetical protein
MFGKMKVLALTGVLAATAFAATGAQAAGWLVGLVDGKSIVTIDPANRKVASKVDVKGAGPLAGIDVRPADGMLYGVAADGTIFTIDIKSGQATMKSKMSETLKPGTMATVDFNPVADRLRVMGSDGTSLRVNVDDGKATVDGSHKYKDGDANAGKTPKVVAGAYTNSSKGTKATALYNIDATTGALVTQVRPMTAYATVGIARDAGQRPWPSTSSRAARIRTTHGRRRWRAYRSISRPARQ